MDIQWTVKRFQELSLDELYDLARLRIDVFVVEQNCPYSELDGYDKHSTHILGVSREGLLVAYSRITDPGIVHELPSIGRVITHPEWRGQGLGHEVMKESMKACRAIHGDSPIWLSAQEHLREYYNGHGFRTISDTYMWDGIPHLDMRYEEGNPVPYKEDLEQQRRSFFAARWEDFDSARNGMLGYLSEWEPELLDRAPEPNSWTALQVLDHVLVSEKGTLGYMLKKTQASAEELPYIEKADRYAASKLLRRLASTERYAAPDQLPPPSDQKDLAELSKEWEGVRQKYQEFLGGLEPGYYGRLVFRHPYSGPMSVEETLGFLIEHIRHHMHQLRRIHQAFEKA